MFMKLLVALSLSQFPGAPPSQLAYDVMVRSVTQAYRYALLSRIHEGMWLADVPAAIGPIELIEGARNVRVYYSPKHGIWVLSDMYTLRVIRADLDEK